MKYLKTIPLEERGILTSAYKQEIKRNIRIEKTKSISRIKSMILNHDRKLQSQTGAILQVSVFVFAIILIVF
jgi:hypothetical protein